MLCQKCGKYQATTHIHSVVNGVVSDINLCNRCAVECGYTSIGTNSFASMLASVFGDPSGVPNSLLNTKCEFCGSDFSTIAHTGKAGCPECYNTFRNELLPYIKRLHGTTHHIGKKPNRDFLVVSKKDEIAELRQKLNELIKKEDFEEAAVVRDEIKKAQEENNNE